MASHQSNQPALIMDNQASTCATLATGEDRSMSSSPNRYTGKVALVTGSSRGIGKAIAMQFARSGADVVINYNSSRKSAQETVEEIKQLGRRAMAVQADVSDVTSITRMFQEAVERFGRLDVVVSNAGVEHFDKLEDITPETYDRVFGINSRGQFFVAQQAYRFIERGGSVVLTSSVAAKLSGLPDHALYGATKAAVEAFVRNLTADFSPKRVRINAIAPGGVDSDMAGENAWRYAPGGHAGMSYEECKRRLAAVNPMKRFAQPQDIAEAVDMLCSPEAHWINGEWTTASRN
ncbi:hypothetical protein KEM52_006317 [Ascosphaera acerosa]|nr:hypothetical protein KEM52_006317 [Ascosphaera acerosa]